MKKMFKDRYFLLAISVAAIILISSVATNDIQNVLSMEDDGICGFCYDVEESSKGFVFYFQDVDGHSRKCFFSEMPRSFFPYLVNGDYSDDGNIFFISSMNEMS